MGLKDLPLVPGCTANGIQDAYVSELKLVTTPEQLRAFTIRWAPLYRMTSKVIIDKKEKNAQRFRISRNNLDRLIAGDYKAEVALECVLGSRGPTGCRHMRAFSCVGMHIVAPVVLIEAGGVARKYGVSTDLALIQMNGGLEALEG